MYAYFSAEFNSFWAIMHWLRYVAVWTLNHAWNIAKGYYYIGFLALTAVSCLLGLAIFFRIMRSSGYDEQTPTISVTRETTSANITAASKTMKTTNKTSGTEGTKKWRGGYSCGHPSSISIIDDGFCDDFANEDCGHDGGDCCIGQTFTYEYWKFHA